jgi:hypothetical protein
LASIWPKWVPRLVGLQGTESLAIALYNHPLNLMAVDWAFVALTGLFSKQRFASAESPAAHPPPTLATKCLYISQAQPCVRPVPEQGYRQEGELSAGM